MMDTAGKERLLEVFEEHLDYYIDQIAQFAARAATLRGYIFTISEGAVDLALLDKFEAVRLKDQAAFSKAEREALDGHLPSELSAHLRRVPQRRRDMVKAAKDSGARGVL